MLNMNPIQRQLLELADTVDLGQETYYSLAKQLNVSHPYKVQFAIEQLVKKGYLLRNNHTKSITKPHEPDETSGLLSIPYYGEVNCGEALAFADDTIKSFLQISPSVIHARNNTKLFALKASGISMNNANIHGSSVEEGDYIISERIEAHEVKNGDYVISLIGGAANLKRFYKDDILRRVVLLSESTEDLPPIIISAEDVDDIPSYQPVARALEVIKRIPAL